MDDADELLTGAIATQLEVDHQYVRHRDEWDAATITQVRRWGSDLAESSQATRVTIVI